MDYRHLFACLVVVLLFASGFYLLLVPKDSPMRGWQHIEKNLTKKTLKKLGNEKIGFMDKFRLQAEEVLKLSNSKITYSHFKIMTAVSCFIGLGIGVAMNNILLSIVLGVIFFLLPLQILRVKLTSYTQYYNEQLHSALSIITNSYMQSDDIVQAMKDNLEHFEEPLLSIFKEFVGANRLLDSNVSKNIRLMKGKIDNYSFHEWCDTLILCQDDREVKFVLPAIVEQMADLKVMQEEVNTMMYQIYREFLLVVGIVIGCIPGMYFLNKEWFGVLLDTFAGQVIVAFVVLVEALCALRVIKINKPIEII